MRPVFNLFTAASLLFISCSDNENCIGNIACTEEFRIITVDVKDADGVPVLLDSTYSLFDESGINYYNNEDLLPGFEGSYTLWTDAEFDLTIRKGSQVTFEGWLNDEKVVTEAFLVGHDCCHVELLEGESEVILQ